MATAQQTELENEVIRKRSFFGTPNSMFEPAHGAKLLNQYLDEKIYTDQELLNFDGIMLIVVCCIDVCVYISHLFHQE